MKPRTPRSRRQLGWQPILAFLALLLAPVAALNAAEGSKPSRPHILYILADDMGYADCGFMGCRDIHTPNLDRLAHSGAVLKSFYVQPVCSPTRASLMTGRYVAHTGVYSIVRPNAPWGLPLAERTLAQALRSAGYTTAIVGKWHLGETQPGYRPTQRGFDHQYGLWFGMVDYFTHMRGKQLDWHRDDQLCHEQGYSTHLIAREACRLVREMPEGKPLFLYLPFNAVHAPLQVPDEYLKPYAKLTGPRRIYAGMVSAMDKAIGQVVAAFKEKGLLDNTLIVFSSDNGGFNPGRVTSNGPLRAGKGTIYEGGLRVCAFATWPGRIPGGKVIDEPLHIIDWYPTLVRLAGGSLEQPLPLDGCDIWPVLTQGAKSPHEALLLSGTNPRRVAIRIGDWKLLLNAHDRDAEEGKESSVGKKVELYNLATDLGEQKNLASEQPGKVAELRAKLDVLLKTAVPPGNAADGAGTGVRPKRQTRK